MKLIADEWALLIHAPASTLSRLQLIKTAMILPDQQASSWLHQWQGSWSNREECLHRQFSVLSCQNKRYITDSNNKDYNLSIVYGQAVVWNDSCFWCNVLKLQNCIKARLHDHTNNMALFLEETLPELVESLLVCIKDMSDVEVQGMGRVPVLQLLEVGVVCESHDV